MKKPSWEQLVEAEPRLGHLLEAVKKVDGSDPRFCANKVWYGRRSEGHRGYKADFHELVGWARKGHPLLGTQAAYDVAYDVLYNALPGCRSCSCL